jgi:hypothetical protein
LIPALLNFAAQKDPKAQIIGSFNIVQGQFVFILLAFYDAPTASNGTFDEFLAIFPFGTLQTQSYLSIVNAAPVGQTANLR